MDILYGIFDAGLYLSVPYMLFRACHGLWQALKKQETLVCLHCGHEGPSTTRSEGLPLLEAALWPLLLLPGLIYSIWRFSTRSHACAECGKTKLAKPDSPAGRAKHIACAGH